MTTEQENIIKDILRLIGKDDELTEQFADALGMGVDEFNNVADAIFNGLQNGRLTVETEVILKETSLE